MNNGQVMLMDDFLSEEEQLLMAQGYTMDEDDENRYYFDQDGNLSNIFKRAFSAIDKGLAKFDRTVIQPIGKAAVKGAVSVIDLKVKSIGLSNAMMKPAMDLKTGQKPNIGDIGNILGSITGKTFNPSDSLPQLIGGSPEILAFLRQKTAVNVPVDQPDLIPQAKEIAQDQDNLKNYIANIAGVPGPGSMPQLITGPGIGPAIQPKTGMDVGSILKNPIVLGVGGLVLLKVLKVF